MQSLIIIAVMLLIVFVVLAAVKNRANSSGALPYERKLTFFTPAERSFFGVLKQVVGDHYEIFGQVRVADLIVVKKGLGNSARQSFFNKIKAKHVDFVLCNPNDLTVVAAIELDDKSHNKSSRVARDKFMDAAFQAAELPLIRFKAQHSYSINDIATSLQSNIGFNRNQLSMNLKTEPIEALSEQEKIQLDPEANTQSAIRCPKCSSLMVRKKATRGKHAGNFFLACSGYPKCKTILPTGA